MRKGLFGTKYASYEAKRKAYTGIVLNVFLFGCESWCLTADLVGTLASWHHARLREMCRVSMHKAWTHRITPDELYERIGIKSIEYYIRVSTLRWVGHVARMDKHGCRVGSSRHGMGSEFTAHWGHRDDHRPFPRAMAQVRQHSDRIIRVVETRPRPAEMAHPHHRDVSTRSPHRKWG